MQPHESTETDGATGPSNGRVGVIASLMTALARVFHGEPDGRAEAPATVRAMLGSIFLASTYTKITAWSYNVGYVESVGLPFPAIALGLSIAVEFVAGTALILGVRPWLMSLVLAGYLVPTSLLFHQFWAVGPDAVASQLLQFAKNVAIVGGLMGVVLSGTDGLLGDAPDEPEVADR